MFSSEEHITFKSKSHITYLFSIRHNYCVLRLDSLLNVPVLLSI